MIAHKMPQEAIEIQNKKNNAISIDSSYITLTFYISLIDLYIDLNVIF
jgi:hypothetical protein